ncbi:hypothetical protein LY76DRAFT_402057 [Colletotrichum caudatum]|nr:hypothetical protein LY76DRAFT_402057 [Colletotrichum caudatum]
MSVCPRDALSLRSAACASAYHVGERERESFSQIDLRRTRDQTILAFFFVERAATRPDFEAKLYGSSLHRPLPLLSASLTRLCACVLWPGRSWTWFSDVTCARRRKKKAQQEDATIPDCFCPLGPISLPPSLSSCVCARLDLSTKCTTVSTGSIQDKNHLVDLWAAGGGKNGGSLRDHTPHTTFTSAPRHGISSLRVRSCVIGVTQRHARRHTQWR